MAATAAVRALSVLPALLYSTGGVYELEPTAILNAALRHLPRRTKRSCNQYLGSARIYERRNNQNLLYLWFTVTFLRNVTKNKRKNKVKPTKKRMISGRISPTSPTSGCDIHSYPLGFSLGAYIPLSADIIGVGRSGAANTPPLFDGSLGTLVPCCEREGSIV